MTERREILIIADAGMLSHDASARTVFATLRRRLDGVADVIQQLPPRMALIRLSAANDTRDLPDIPGVEYCLTDVPVEIDVGLTAGERLFVDAWRLRAGSGFADKQRKGEGLNWDAAGFHPPDGPRTQR